jgi:hypothetical protein
MENQGFIYPTFEEDHYELGGLDLYTKPVLNPSLDWLPQIPYGERQKKTIDTNSCTEFGFLNQLETLETFKYGESSNWSERFLAIGAENQPLGNDPHKVMEWARHNGLVKEESLPFTEDIKTWSEYMQPDPLPRYLTDEAKEWLPRYEFKHEWLWKKQIPLHEKQERILDALQYSPIAVSVNWVKRGDTYYKPTGARDVHWTVIAKGEKAQPWKIYDSYIDDDFIKTLDWDFDFGVAKLITLEKKPEIVHPYWFVDLWYGLTRGRTWAI